MKGTDFYAVGKYIKEMEVAELKKALKAHGGSYTWYDTGQDEDSDEYISVDETDDIPIAMVNGYAGLTEMYIYKAWVNKDGNVEINAFSSEDETLMEIDVFDIEACHINFLTLLIKDIDGVEIRGKNHLYALEEGKVKCLTAPNEVTKAPLSDLLDAIPFIEIMFEFNGETYVRRIHTQLIDQNHYEDMWDWWTTGSPQSDGRKPIFEILADKGPDGSFTVNNMRISVFADKDDDDAFTVIKNIRYRTSEEESFKTIKQ